MIIVSATDALRSSLGFAGVKNLECCFIAPHADDLEISSGGTMSRLAFEEDATVREIVVTDSTGFVRTFSMQEERIPQIRRAEASRAGELVGVTQFIFGGFGSVKDPSVQPALKVMLCSLLKQFRPHAIFMPHPKIDPHETHRIVANLALESLSEIGVGKDVLKIAYPVWAPFSVPDLLVDISSFFRLKEVAINQYATQVYDRDYATAALGLNEYYALGQPHTSMSMHYAEAFMFL